MSSASLLSRTILQVRRARQGLQNIPREDGLFAGTTLDPSVNRAVLAHRDAPCLGLFARFQHGRRR